MRAVIVFLITTLILCTGCSVSSKPIEAEEVNQGQEVAASEEKYHSDILEIREKYFMLQIDDIYFNFDQYEGKIIKVQGMYNADIIDENRVYHSVFRYGPGCCGNDGWGGFYLNYKGEYPEINEWIEVVGTPEIVRDGPVELLYLNVQSITVLEERGAEFVMQ